MLVEIGVTVLTIIFLVIGYFKWTYTYWARKNVPYIEPSIPWGTNENPFKPTKAFNVQLKDFYNEFKSQGKGYGGLYLFIRPSLVLVKPDLVKRILQKDFNHFNGHGLHVDEENNPVTGNLFFLDGDRWKNLRMKLTPTFTSGKMKMMFPTLLACGEPMVEHINQLSIKNEAMDIKDILSCFTTDVIGSCAFGIDCNSFADSEAEFRKHGRKFFEQSRKANFFKVLSFIFPKLSVSGTNKETLEFFTNNFTSIVNYRIENDYKRNDFVQLLLEINEKAKSTGTGDGLTIGQMIAQSIMFFAAGFETSSTTMTFALHELAHNLDIQEKLRKEIVENIEKHEGKITYEGISEMKYLQMVLDETLRKYPPASAMNRVCNKKYVIEETGTVIDEGTQVFVSVLGLHRDPEYYPNPDKFDPERFSEQNKNKIAPFTYIPFGEGPRICIGLRFGLMNAKVGLSLLLKNFKFTPHKNMPYNMEFSYVSGVLSFKETPLLNAERIK